MNFKELFTEDRAVSPVIGVILMVAITVILAAVIGAFVLGIGGDQNATPSASISLDVDTGDTDTDGTVTIEHNSGQTLDLEELRLSIDGTFAEDEDGNQEVSVLSEEDSLSAGESVEVDDGVELESDGDQSVRLIHEPSGGILASTTS